MTEKERFLAAMQRQPVDYVPFVPTFNPLSPAQRVGQGYNFPFGPGESERVWYAVEKLGIGASTQFCSARAFYPSEGVSSKVWIDGDTIHKVFSTPDGDVGASVRYNERWPHGLDIPMFSSFNEAHFIEPWLRDEHDLACLKHVLNPPWRPETLDKLKFSARVAHERADRYQIPVHFRLTCGISDALLLIGTEDLMYLWADKPDLIREYLEHDQKRAMENLEICLDLGIDYVQRNGFYETADFWNPAVLEAELAPLLREQIDATHQGGALICYTVNTGVMPILNHLDKLEFDSIFGIDLDAGDTDLQAIVDKLGHSKSLWVGPVSHAHIEKPTDEPVRRVVRECFETIGHTGLILGFAVSTHAIMPWENTLATIDEWKKMREPTG